MARIVGITLDGKFYVLRIGRWVIDSSWDHFGDIDNCVCIMFCLSKILVG